jgi:GNAT superfamily N-acetyltransferase
MSSASTISVRRATAEDARALAALRYEFRSSRSEPIETESEFVLRCAAWMAPRLAVSEPWRAWLIEIDGTLAGNLWLELVEKIPNPGVERERHGYVTNFYVRTEHRGSGIGTRLLHAALEECGALGVDSIFLWPSDRSRPLYLRHGFRPADEVLIRAHSDPAPLP